MFNLLPQEQKKKIRQIYLSRFGVVVSVGGILLTLILCLSLVPSFIVSSQKANEAEQRKQIIENSIPSADREQLRAQLLGVKNDIDTLEKPTVSIVQLLEKVINNKGTGVSINGFTLSPLSTGEEKLVIDGVAQTREKLQEFSDNMEAQKFKKVDLPISSFAKDKDISFEMTITTSNE